MPPSSPDSAPSTGFGQILRDIAGFATSQYTLRFTNIIRGLVVAKLLGPSGNGLLQHFVIIFEYGLHGHFGVLPGYNKHLGHQLGAGDAEEIRAARATGLGGMILAGLLFWIGLCVYVGLNWETVHPVDRWGLPIVGLLVILENVTNTYRALLRAYGRIRPISTLAVTFAFSNLALSLALLPGLKIYGLLIGWLVTRAITTIWFIRKSGEGFGISLDLGTLRTLLITGLPISAFHITRLMLRNIDRVLVDTVLEKSDLGIYGLAVTLAHLVRYGADAVAFVIYPIFQRLYGETRDPTRLRAHLEQPTAFLALFVPVLLGLLFLTLHLPILWILPRFAASIDIFRLLTVSVLFASLSVLPGFYMMAINRQSWLILVGAGSVAFTYLVGFWAIDAGYGLTGVALVTDIALALDATIVLLLAGRFAFGSLPRALGWIARTYVAPAYVAVVVAAIRWGIPRTALGAWNDVSRSLLEGALFVAVMVPLLVWFERRNGFLSRLRARRAPGA